jgi:hypothetical protein
MFFKYPHQYNATHSDQSAEPADRALPAYWMKIYYSSLSLIGKYGSALEV